jgi:Uncharacterized protein conserved in bacteria (DUF2252)
LRIYGELCAWSLPRAHACSGDRIAIAVYLGGSDVFDQAITLFAAAYADQNERDHHSARHVCCELGKFSTITADAIKALYLLAPGLVPLLGLPDRSLVHRAAADDQVARFWLSPTGGWRW